MTARLHPLVMAELEACGRPWSREPGKKHDKLLIDGAVVTIIPRGGNHAKEDDHRREALNCRGHIRRFLKGLA